MCDFNYTTPLPYKVEEWLLQQWINSTCITTETQTLHAPVPVSLDYTGMFNAWLSIRKKIWNQYMKTGTLWDNCRICCCRWLLLSDGWSCVRCRHSWQFHGWSCIQCRQSWQLHGWACVQYRQSWQLHGWACVQYRQSWQLQRCFCNLMGHQSYAYPCRPDILQGHMQHTVVAVNCYRENRLSDFRRMIKCTRKIICSKNRWEQCFL